MGCVGMGKRMKVCLVSCLVLHAHQLRYPGLHDVGEVRVMPDKKQTWFISEKTFFVACETCRFPTWILNRQWPPQRRDNPSSSGGPWYLRQRSRKYIPGLGRDTCGKGQESIFLGWAVILAAKIQKVYTWAGPWCLSSYCIRSIINLFCNQS